MKIRKLFLFGVIGAFSLNSCSTDDDTPEPVPEGDYTNGTLVLHEGNVATVAFISDDLQTVQNDIYASVNGGDDLGQWAQSMFFTEDLAFVIGSGSNMITVVDRYSFELIGKIETGLENPRYGAVVNGKAYVTNAATWDTTTDDYVAVIDVEILEMEDPILIGEATEEIIEEDGLLYIQSAAFGNGNMVRVLNPTTNSVERTFEVKEGLNDIDIYNDHLYTLSSGGIQVIDLSTDEIVMGINFTEDLTGGQKLDVEEDMIYYTIGNNVYRIAIDASEPADEALVGSGSESISYLYAMDVEDGKIYVADADFSASSFVYVYTIGGELLEKIGVGIAPNGFYFNE